MERVDISVETRWTRVGASSEWRKEWKNCINLGIGMIGRSLETRWTRVFRYACIAAVITPLPRVGNIYKTREGRRKKQGSATVTMNIKNYMERAHDSSSKSVQQDSPHGGHVNKRYKGRENQENKTRFRGGWGRLWKERPKGDARNGNETTKRKWESYKRKREKWQ